MNGSLRIAASLLAAASFASTALAQVDGPIGQKSDELVTVTLATAAERESLALLTLGRRGSIVCSASLLTNEWAVTASHCLNPADVTRPGNITLTAAWGRGQAFSPDRIYRFWGVVETGDYDIALLHLPTPFDVNGSTTGYRREISELSLEDMKDKQVRAFGAGINVLAARVNGVNVPSSTDNQYRVARFTVSSIEAPKLFWYPTTSAGETIAGGDSGGPSFEFTSGNARIAGVHALCHNECLNPGMCPAGNAWRWTSRLLECGDAPLSSVAAAIRDIMNQPWNPARPVQTIQVAHSEGQVSRDLLLGQIDALPWDYVRRAAQKYCENRGFVAGYADGQHTPGTRYEVKCVGAGAGRKVDALPLHLARTSDRFRHVAELDWVRAARAANDVCKVIDATSVGGMLTGFEWTSPPEFPMFDQRVGVFCLNAANATWFDASLAELNRPGTDVDKLENLSWAAAGRAAAQFCRAKLFRAGGFFNGHQRGDKRGVICVGTNTAVATGLTPRDMNAEQRSGTGIEIGPGMGTAVEPVQQAPATEKTRLLRELEALAGRGAGIAGQDPLSAELRRRAAEGPARRGFDIGMAAAEGQTQDGPGKQRIRTALSAAEQEGYDVALAFSLQRNANAARAKIGAAIAQADAGVSRARSREPDVFYWLGFDIASGIFGDPARGAQGNTATGPGSLAVRDALSPAAQRGFNASVALHLGRKYR